MQWVKKSATSAVPFCATIGSPRLHSFSFSVPFLLPRFPHLLLAWFCLSFVPPSRSAVHVMATSGRFLSRHLCFAPLSVQQVMNNQTDQHNLGPSLSPSLSPCPTPSPPLPLSLFLICSCSCCSCNLSHYGISLSNLLLLVSASSCAVLP